MMAAEHLRLIRWLHFGSGGAAEDETFGSVPTMSPTVMIITVNSGNSSPGIDDDKGDTRSSMERAIDVLIIIAAGIAMVLGLLLLTWLLAKIFDRYCCCCPFSQPVSSTADQEFDRGPVSRKAGLWGLLQTERMQILQHLFQPVVWTGNHEDEDADVVVLGEKSEAKTSECLISSTDTITKDEELVNQTLSSPMSNQPDNSNPLDDAQHQRVCCICLNPYEPNCQVMTGKICSHMYHYNCCMKWLKRHDECPYCRQELMTGQQFREAAVQVLGETRVRGSSGARLQIQENPTGVDSSNNNGSGGGEDFNSQSQQLAEEGDNGIEMGRVVMGDEDSQPAYVEA